MKKRILGIVIILVVLVLAVLTIPMLEKEDTMGVVEETIEEMADAMDVVYDAETESEANISEMEADVELQNIAEEMPETTLAMENTATAPKVVEVVKEDSNTDKVVLENRDGEKSEVYMGVVDLDENLIIPDEDDAGSDTEITDFKAETEPTKETGTPREETDDIIISQPEQIGPDKTTTYQEYEAMSAQEQTLFYYSFANAEAFTDWYNNAKAEYEASIDKVYINADGSVDAG